MGKMKRHEWWRMNYRNSRDLDHLSPEQLSERLFDCINNMRVRTEQEKLGLLSPNEGGEQWFILQTEIMEECALRGYSYPGPINISRYRKALEHAFDPVPQMETIIEKHKLASKPYLLKFGNPVWLRPALDLGKFRIAAASYYDSSEHNHARRDKELERILTLNPRNPRLNDLIRKLGIKVPEGKIPSSVTIKSSTDYYLFSLCASYTSRLFGDFASTGCLVIYNRDAFLERFARAVKERLAGWSHRSGPIIYFDPVRVDPNFIDVPFCKPLRHTYQKELRLAWMPPSPVEQLECFEIEMGPLADCAELVEQVPLN